MAAPNEGENGAAVANANANASADQQGQTPGMLSKISNTIQAIKMPWNKDEQAAAAAAAAAGAPTTPPIPGDAPPAGDPNGTPPPDGQQNANVFSSTMSKVSNTFSNIQMPWNSKDQPGAQPTQAPQPSSSTDVPAGSSGSGSPPADGSVISGAFSKVTNTLSSIQMPWNSKGDQQKADGQAPSQEQQPDAAAAAGDATADASAAGEGNVLSNTFSKVSNTFSGMHMPWTNKAGEAGGSAQSSPPPDSGSQANANVNGSAATESSPLNKVTGFFSSVFRQGSASQQSDPIAEAAVNAEGETSQKAE